MKFNAKSGIFKRENERMQRKTTRFSIRHLFFGIAAIFSLIALPSAQSAEFRGITLGLVSVSWNTQLPPAIAQKAGFFKDEGLDVRIITIASGGPIMMALLSSGEADMVVSGAVAIMRGIASGAPAVVVGSQLGKPDYTLMGAKGMSGLEDLKGKVVGSTGAGSFSEFAVVESLRRKGMIRNRDYKLLSVGGTAVRIAALQTKKIDAAPLSSGERVNVEGEGFPVLLEIGKVLPEFPFTVLAATKKFAGSSPEKVSAMLRALDRAIRLIREDKDKAVQIGKAYGLRGDPTTQRKALEYVADDFEVALKRDQVAALLKVLEIKNSPEELFDERYLGRALGKK
jgi:NitT/TauT family transport system substrate-binding protein